jgi:hypothetical protein
MPKFNYELEAVEENDAPSEALAFSNKAEAGYKRGQKLDNFPSQFFRCCCLVK